VASRSRSPSEASGSFDTLASLEASGSFDSFVAFARDDGGS
jgi:hypothetical protein